ncbi:MAG: ABC transporter ATP-binding protein [Bifidobacterium sp.]|jgi:ABC-2 type transport system ATP-binding protein
MLSLTNVSKRFGGHDAVRAVNVQFQPGVIYGLLGKNGAGKTSVLSMIGNRTLPDSGTILLDGVSVVDDAPAQRRMFLSNEAWPYPLYSTLSGIFSLVAYYYGDFDRELAGRMLRSFGIGPADRFGRLSEGKRQAVKAILALCAPTDYVMCDEPTKGLDATGRETLYRYILEAYDRRERTIILSTHAIAEVEGIIEHAVVLDGGTVLESFDLSNLVNQGVTLTAERGVMDSYLDKTHPRVMSRQSLGNLSIVAVHGTVRGDLPAGIVSRPLDLQSYVIQLTSGGNL